MQVVLLAGLAALPVATASPAQAQFGAPFTVSATAESLDPRVAVDADGDAVFVWRRRDGIGWRIRARSRSKAGIFGPVLTLSQAKAKKATLPNVAVDAEGDAVFAWQLGDPPSSGVYGRTLSARGTLGPIHTLSGSAPGGRYPQVAVDADGDALFVWEENYSWTSETRVKARALSKAGVLGPTQTLSASGNTSLVPQVAVDADGDAVIAWTYDPIYWVQARFRSKAGALGPVQTLSDDDAWYFGPQVAVNADGTAVVAWSVSGPDLIPYGLQARVKVGTGFRPIQWIAGDPLVKNHHVAVDAAGNAFFVWQSRDGTNWRIKARALTKAGALGRIQTLSAAGQDAQDPQVAVDTQGNVVFAWRRHDGTSWRVQARRGGETQTVSEAGQSAGPPHLAVAPNGRTVVTWHGRDPGMQGHRIFGAATP